MNHCNYFASAANGLHLYGQDPESKTSIFRDPLIQTLINKVWFKNKEDDGVIHPEFSKSDILPMATIAFVQTVESLIFHIDSCYYLVLTLPSDQKQPWRVGHQQTCQCPFNYYSLQGQILSPPQTYRRFWDENMWGRHYSSSPQTYA